MSDPDGIPNPYAVRHLPACWQVMGLDGSILVTCNSEQEARDIARTLLEHHLRRSDPSRNDQPETRHADRDG